RDPLDLRFMLLYVADDSGGRTATLAGASRIVTGTTASPQTIELGDLGELGELGELGQLSDTGAKQPPSVFSWPVARVLRTGTAEIVEELGTKFDVCTVLEVRTPPRRALILPLAPPGEERAAGVLVVGLSPRLVQDEAYLGFLHLAGRQI